MLVRIRSFLRIVHPETCSLSQHRAWPHYLEKVVNLPLCAVISTVSPVDKLTSPVQSHKSVFWNVMFLKQSSRSCHAFIWCIFNLHVRFRNISKRSMFYPTRNFNCKKCLPTEYSCIGRMCTYPTVHMNTSNTFLVEFTVQRSTIFTNITILSPVLSGFTLTFTTYTLTL